MEGLNGFDRIAGYYDGLAWLVFGSSIKQAQTKWLGEVPPNSMVLVLGGGTGWWLADLLMINPGCRVWFVEPSGRMLEIARKKVGQDARVSFLHGTIDSITGPARFDVVITFFVLDLFSTPDLTRFISQTKTHLKSDGFWLVSDFVERKWWHSALLFVMYRFFGLTTNLRTRKLPLWEKVMSENGLVAIRGQMHCVDFIKSVLYQTPNY